MPDSTQKTTYLKDYTPSPFLIRTVELDVALFDDCARVTSRLTLQRNPAATSPDAPFALDGEELTLESLALNGRTLVAAEYNLTGTFGLELDLDQYIEPIAA